MTEIWKIIEDYPEYKISNLGRVMSLNYRRTGKEKVLNIGTNQRYCYVNLKGKLFYIHRLVAAAFVPNPDGKTDVNHINCDTHDNRASNLEWVSRNENISKYYKSEKYHKLKTADRVYYLTKKGSDKPEYNLIVGSGYAEHIETGEKLKVYEELIKNGYVIKCRLIGIDE